MLLHINLLLLKWIIIFDILPIKCLQSVAIQLAAVHLAGIANAVLARTAQLEGVFHLKLLVIIIVRRPLKCLIIRSLHVVLRSARLQLLVVHDPREHVITWPRILVIVQVVVVIEVVERQLKACTIVIIVFIIIVEIQLIIIAIKKLILIVVVQKPPPVCH